MGLEGTFSDGIISGIRQFEEGSLLQITAPISLGSSGGPILDIEGNAIGLAVATYQDGQNLNFAVPVEYLGELLKNKNTNIEPLSEQKIDDNVAYDFGNKSIEGIEVIQFSFDE
ncbi:MAG: trypsin-like peptidase domain-containing protein [Bacillota bacterium]